jgi:hypothetical protein
MSKERYVVTIIVERDCNEELDTAVVADIMEQTLHGMEAVKPVAMKVAKALEDGYAGRHYTAGAFMVTDPLEKVFLVDRAAKQDGRAWNEVH